MIEIEYSTDKGVVTECTNICFDAKGEPHTFSLNTNAVLVQLVRMVDEDGEIILRRIISLSLVDADMKDALMEEAHRILALK
jgi:hypothetical protein